MNMSRDSRILFRFAALSFALAFVTGVAFGDPQTSAKAVGVTKPSQHKRLNSPVNPATGTAQAGIVIISAKPQTPPLFVEAPPTRSRRLGVALLTATLTANTPPVSALAE